MGTPPFDQIQAHPTPLLKMQKKTQERTELTLIHYNKFKTRQPGIENDGHAKCTYFPDKFNIRDGKHFSILSFVTKTIISFLLSEKGMSINVQPKIHKQKTLSFWKLNIYATKQVWISFFRSLFSCDRDQFDSPGFLLVLYLPVPILLLAAFPRHL